MFDKNIGSDESDASDNSDEATKKKVPIEERFDDFFKDEFKD